MSPLSPHPHQWAKVPAALAVAVTGLGAVFAGFWGLTAGLWTFSTQEYGSFLGVAAITLILVGTPLIGFRVALEGKARFALAITVPALALYGATLLAILRH